jgi:hypothetical protein
MSDDQKRTSTIDLVILGLVGTAFTLPFLASEDCSNDPNAPAAQRCEGSGGTGSGGSVGSGGGGNHSGGARTSERGGFGDFARRFTTFS